MNKKMPLLFLSHGSPMNLVLDNDYTRALKILGQEHFLPLLYVIGAQEKDDKVEVIHQSIQNSSVSMTCIKIG